MNVQFQQAIDVRQVERRRHQRVKVQVAGRFMREDRLEFPCVSIDFSPGGVALQSNAVVSLRERIIVYFNQLGRIEGRVARHLEGGFALQMSLPEVKREKIASQLTWLANRSALGLAEDRRHERIAPRYIDTTLTLPSGRSLHVRVIDVSRSGAALSAELGPPVGTPVTLGKRRAQVVRHFNSGFAVEFDRLIPENEFDGNVEI